MEASFGHPKHRTQRFQRALVGSVRHAPLVHILAHSATFVPHVVQEHSQVLLILYVVRHNIIAKRMSSALPSSSACSSCSAGTFSSLAGKSAPDDGHTCKKKKSWRNYNRWLVSVGDFSMRPPKDYGCAMDQTKDIFTRINPSQGPNHSKALIVTHISAVYAAHGC